MPRVIIADIKPTVAILDDGVVYHNAAKGICFVGQERDSATVLGDDVVGYGESRVLLKGYGAMSSCVGDDSVAIKCNRAELRIHATSKAIAGRSRMIASKQVSADES